MADQLELKDFISATIDASNRARSVLLILAFLSVVAIGAAWNQYGGEWERLSQFEQAAAYRVLDPPLATVKLDQHGEIRPTELRKFMVALRPTQPPQDKRTAAVTTSSTDRVVTASGAAADAKDKDEKEEALRRLRQQFPENLSPDEKLARLRVLIALREQVKTLALNPSQLEQGIEKLQDAAARTYSFQLPVVGVSFDTDDIVLVLGVAYCVLLVVLRSSLFGHLRYLRFTFTKGASVLRECYQLLAMQQVIRVPPHLDQEDVQQHRWTWSTTLLFWLPALVMTWTYGTMLFDDFGDVVGKTPWRWPFAFVTLIYLLPLAFFAIWLWKTAGGNRLHMEKRLAGPCIVCLIVGLLVQEILLQSLARDLGVILRPVPLSPMRILGAILYELVVGITGQCLWVLHLTSAEWDSKRIALNVLGPIHPSRASVGSEVNGVDS